MAEENMGWDFGGDSEPLGVRVCEQFLAPNGGIDGVVSQMDENAEIAHLLETTEDAYNTFFTVYEA